MWIDLNQLQDPDDVKRDVYGKWNSGSHIIPFKSWYTEESDVELEHLKPGYTGLDVQVTHFCRQSYKPRFSYMPC